MLMMIMVMKMMMMMMVVVMRTDLFTTRCILCVLLPLYVRDKGFTVITLLLHC
jgi:hypothetical protein